MTTTVTRKCDPAALAASVRLLARRAYRALQNPSTPPAEIDTLLQQTRRLREQVQDWPSDELPLWLEHVERSLESA